MTATAVRPADVVADCLAGGVRRLLGGAHSLTSARAVVVRADQQWVWVKFSTDPGRLPAPWECVDAGPGWVRAPRGSEPGLRDASADPVLVVVGVGEDQVIAVNALAIDEIGVTCRGREALIANWLLQAQVQGVAASAGELAGVRLSANPDATVVVADPLLDGEPGWVDVLAAGTSWPVRPLRGGGATPSAAPQPAGVQELSEVDEDDDVGAVVDGDRGSGGDAGVVDASNGSAVGAAAKAVGGQAQMMVFGAFEVTDASGAALQPMQQQIIGAIAFGQPISTAQLCQSLYGTSRQKSFHVALSKIRRRGLHPRLTDEGYCLDIASQWGQFVELVGPDPARAETAALVRAAAMVRTPLFGAQPPSWAQQYLPAMADLICQVCRELAARHADEPAAALDYARLGLAVDPGRAELGQIVEMLTNGTWNSTAHDVDGPS